MLFNTYPLTESELLAGSILTTYQKKVIENRMAELATELVNTAHSRTDDTYFDKVNFNKGQLAELQQLLVASEQAEQYTETKEN